jgi:hypothetical protein
MSRIENRDILFDRLYEIEEEETRKNGKLDTAWWILLAADATYRDLYQNGRDAKRSGKTGRLGRTFQDWYTFVDAVKKAKIFPRTLLYLQTKAKDHLDDDEELDNTIYNRAEQMMDEVITHYKEKYLPEPEKPASTKKPKTIKSLCYVCPKIATSMWETMPAYRFCSVECAKKTWENL